MRKLTQPILPFESKNIPKGDWYHLSPRQQKKALEDEVRWEMDRLGLHIY
ncbi:MAG: hypothetical protein GX540_00550 [Clostridiales bacterium]|nr:hypothetical protein [Clostridiales bacterium]